MSHLSTLIQRIRKTPRKERDSPIFKGRLMNLAEYMVYQNDSTEQEQTEAHIMFNKYSFEVELSEEGLKRKQRELHQIGYTCMRCGRRLTNPYSKKKGLGPECLKKI